MAWSGGMTALEAVGSGLLPVALEGPRMRMRHTAAILRTLGLDELIAGDPDGLVATAAALAGDRERHTALRERMIAAAPGLWEDARPVRALEAWLCEAVAAATR
jgi:predicted O-linked N-acetylglucosamine transferase (SPINDLY family)